MCLLVYGIFGYVGYVIGNDFKYEKGWCGVGFLVVLMFDELILVNY